MNSYEDFLQQLNLEPWQEGQCFDLSDYSGSHELASGSLVERLTAALYVLVHLISCLDPDLSTPFESHTIDFYLSEIDKRLSDQINEILGNADFQSLEAAWRGLSRLVQQAKCEPSDVQLSLWDVAKEELRDDFQGASHTEEMALYELIYNQEYDAPGGIPVALMVSDYCIENTPEDLSLLHDLAEIASRAHCPWLASVGAAFFGKEAMQDVSRITDLKSYLGKAEFIAWQTFRRSEHAKYIGLTLPKFLVRCDYGAGGEPVRTFSYQQAMLPKKTGGLWCSAAYPFAENIIRSFCEHGWPIHIRGSHSGGQIKNLPRPTYCFSHGLIDKFPTEILIPEAREIELAESGFIPLSYYKNSHVACFFSANSTQNFEKGTNDRETANGRINARLPYVLLLSRLAHFLKVIQRENIGTIKSRLMLEVELNKWLSQYVTKMDDPDQHVLQAHPLRDAAVAVREREDNPGYYLVSLQVVPHFQLEGIDVSLSLMSQLPRISS